MSYLLVSIVTFNSERFIARCLGALAEQTDLNFSIVIHDNASTDRTIAMVTDFITRTKDRISVQVISLPVNLGFCGGHNRAVNTFMQIDDAEWIVFLNPDLRLRR